jgi:hypothetical protein
MTVRLGGVLELFLEEMRDGLTGDGLQHVKAHQEAARPLDDLVVGAERAPPRDHASGFVYGEVPLARGHLRRSGRPATAAKIRESVSCRNVKGQLALTCPFWAPVFHDGSCHSFTVTSRE